MKRKITGYVTAMVMAGLLSSLSSAKAGEPSSSMSHGYKTYFRFHPPQDKPVKNNLYPFEGPIIPTGQDIPVCAAARVEESYARKKSVRYILHGKNGWLFRTSDFKTDFTASPQTMEYFTRLNRSLAARGQTLVVAFQPPRGLVSSKYIDPAAAPKGYTPEKAREGYKAFLKQLDDTGIVTVDLSDVPSDVTYFEKGDFHWSPAGARDSAKKIAEALRDVSGYGSIDKQDFESEVIGLAPASRGTFEEFIQQTCHVNIELTTKPVWSTHAKAAKGSDAESLFGNASFPAISIVGTSNSAQDDKFDFVGALKRFSRADIYNAALTGGGFGSSSYRYFASDEYRAHPPKIVVWEFLPQHDYNNAESLNAFRQMIPAVYGACRKDRALADFFGEITQKKTEFFSKIKDQSLKNTYLYLEATNPKERTLSVEILYKNGNADRVDLTRSSRMANNGKYYLELGNALENNAMFFHLITDIPQGHLSARLCQYPVTIAEK
jgi:alginate biosynthesis protein AlgX